jgi:hypothetical protein
MLVKLAALTWLIDSQGIGIEVKDDVKAALGHSSDIAEALMLAIGEPPVLQNKPPKKT